ncbi:TGACG-sequence-specific DNA-binding protein TGA-2.1-like [Solanum dulcamara]|uniref:TGACG-sequence-specific DNA-binding protein TGA-2.1-like n=1 Tax=Solanum dulcamara TaxID=45834 RepID=UPI002485EB04|nr:TGACG-sequence-specific DNA-binding protein TGA-2.1-like [Solanum dulcamara]
MAFMTMMMIVRLGRIVIQRLGGGTVVWAWNFHVPCQPKQGVCLLDRARCTELAYWTLAFDAEYSRWLEEHNKHINELRTAVNSHASDPELRSIVNNVTAHYDEVFRVKGNAAKADVFHVLSGMWKTPAERCFMWIGGFRPSELLKLLVNQLEPLTEQQLAGIYNLQQSSHQAEDALSQGMEALQQSLAETLANGSPATEGSSGDVANYMGQMAMAMGKLGTLEGFLRQADNLRQQTLQHMHRILTTRQSARALLAISEYFSRLRALSSLWLARPREQ